MELFGVLMLAFVEQFLKPSKQKQLMPSSVILLPGEE
jgi:hypothetical protein